MVEVTVAAWMMLLQKRRLLQLGLLLGSQQLLTGNRWQALLACRVKRGTGVE